jgi:hypothetical protein
MAAYTTKPIIDSIINNFKKLEDKPADNKALSEIDQLLIDELDRFRHIKSLLYDYQRLSEIQQKLISKKNELDLIYGD